MIIPIVLWHGKNSNNNIGLSFGSAADSELPQLLGILASAWSVRSTLHVNTHNLDVMGKLQAQNHKKVISRT